MPGRFQCLALLALTLTLTGCFDGEKPQTFATVDVELVMRDSKAAKAGRAHVEAATERLRQGWRELREAAKNEPEEQRQKTLAQGLQILQQRIRAEESAARQVVHALMLEEVRKWRRANKVSAVIARQNLLDVSGARDVTRAVIGAMDAREARFAELPVVTVKPEARDAPEEEKPAGPADPRPKNDRPETKKPAPGGRR